MEGVTSLGIIDKVKAAGRTRRPSASRLEPYFYFAALMRWKWVDRPAPEPG